MLKVLEDVGSLSVMSLMENQDHIYSFLFLYQERYYLCHFFNTGFHISDNIVKGQR